MTRAQIENAIYSVVQGRLGIAAIWANPTTASGVVPMRPNPPYAELNLLTDEPDGLPDQLGDAVLSGGSYLEQLTEDRYTRCSVKVYGAGAWDKISDLRLYLQTSTARGLLDIQGLGLAGMGSPLDLTALDGAGYEQVVTMDLRLHRRETLEVDEGYMESATISITHKDGVTTIATDTITADTEA